MAICNNNDQSPAVACNGNLINDQWIVTSAKCVCGESLNQNTLSFRLKKTRPCSVMEDGELEIFVSEIHCHPNYNSSSEKVVDLALIKAKFRIPVHESNNTLPLCLETSGDKDLYNYARPSTFITIGLENSENDQQNARLVLARMFLAPLSTCLQKISADFARNPAIFCMQSSKEGICVVSTGSAIINIDAHNRMIFAGISPGFSGTCSGLENTYVASTKMQDMKVLQWAKTIITKQP